MYTTVGITVGGTVVGEAEGNTVGVNVGAMGDVVGVNVTGDMLGTSVSSVVGPIVGIHETDGIQEGDALGTNPDGEVEILEFGSVSPVQNVWVALLPKSPSPESMVTPSKDTE